MNNIQPIKYIIELESIRAIAIVFVLIGHFVPDSNKIFPFALVGVRLFLLLSGFLITTVLIKGKRDVNEKRVTLGQYFFRFYFKRVLRIFPAYFVLLALLIILIPDFYEELKWHAFFLSNIYFSIHGFTGHTGHFWSLAVEEQFYIIWPLILLFSKHEWIVCVYGIMVGLIFKFLMLFNTSLNSIALSVLLPGCFDSLFLGALLAVFYVKFRDDLFKSVVRKKMKFLFVLIPIIIVIFIFVLKVLLIETFYIRVVGIFLVFLFNVWFVCLIYFIINNEFKLMLNKLWGLFFNSYIYFIGRISYSLYLIHNFVPSYLEFPLSKLPFAINTELKIFLYFVLSVMFAYVFYRLIEVPFLNIKNKLKHV